MVVDLCIRDVKIPTRSGLVGCGLAIDEGKVHRLAKAPNLPKASEYVKGKGKLALPGLIDVHVHCRDQGLAHKEDFFTCTRAAAMGGFTTILDMPNNEPPTNNGLRLRERAATARRKIVTNVGFHCTFPESEDGVKGLCEEGAIGFKIYLVKPITAIDVDDDDALRGALSWAAVYGRTVSIHAESREIVEKLTADLRGRGRNDLEAFSLAHPPEAEVGAVERVLSLAKEVGARIHFCHVTVGRAISMIDRAKRSGLSVTSEVTPHHLLLTREDMVRIGTTALVDPPLREPADRDRLMSATAAGTVDVVASDHAPHMIDEKIGQRIWDVATGFPGLETELPLLLTQVNGGALTVQRLVHLLSENPARIFGLAGKGGLREGYDADVTIVDPKEEFKIDPSAFHSKAKYSPFEGVKVKGRPVRVLVRGRTVMEDGEIVAEPGSGSIVAPRIS
ncbi:MAG: dihydroorotase family protein [Candidatus Bathyarchaeia archaeon]